MSRPASDKFVRVYLSPKNIQMQYEEGEPRLQETDYKLQEDAHNL